MRRGVLWAGLCTPALLASVLAAGAATAAEKKTKEGEARDAAAPTQVGPGQSGLVVVRDKDTGELRAPEAGEAADLLRQAVPANNFSDEGLVQVPLPRGGYTVDLQGRFQHYFVVRRGADGQLEPACVDHPAAGHVQAPPPAPSKPGEER